MELAKRQRKKKQLDHYIVIVLIKFLKPEDSLSFRKETTSI